VSNCSNVVPPKTVVSEADFQTAVTLGLARAQSKLGSQKALAYVMDLSTKQVGNVMASGETAAKRLWDVHAAEGSALSDIADLYGVRIVPKDAVCNTDDKPLSVSTCALLKKAIDAELDGVVTHQELLGMETELREMRAMIDARLETVAALRAPRAA
jgi:hypothetical protein